MSKLKLSAACAVILIVTLVFYSADKLFSYPFPQTKISPVEKYVMFDLLSVVSGIRRLAADIAWVQTLQYYGTELQELDEEEKYELSWELINYFIFGKTAEHKHTDEENHDSHEHSQITQEQKLYPDLYKYCNRVVQLDPFFNYAYLYGAGALAWNENRPEEALTLLRNGIDTLEKFKKEITKDPQQPFWQFNLYVAAIIYRKEGKFDEMLKTMETAASQPQAPNLLKTILANIYEKQKKYQLSLKLWLDIYDSKDPSYENKALSKISELKKLLNIT